MNAPHPPLLRVEVVYARPERQLLRAFDVPAGTTLVGAVRASGILEQFPEIELERATLGVFGRPKPGSTPVQDGDRVEIYRPLLVDPKQARRRRAADQEPG